MKEVFTPNFGALARNILVALTPLGHHVASHSVTGPDSFLNQASPPGFYSAWGLSRRAYPQVQLVRMQWFLTSGFPKRTIPQATFKTRAALRLSPLIESFSPSTNPHARATQFLCTRPKALQPFGSSAGRRRVQKPLGDSFKGLHIMDMGHNCCRYDSSTSGAMVGPCHHNHWIRLPSFLQPPLWNQRLAPEPPHLPAPVPLPDLESPETASN